MDLSASGTASRDSGPQPDASQPGHTSPRARRSPANNSGKVRGVRGRPTIGAPCTARSARHRTPSTKRQCRTIAGRTGASSSAVRLCCATECSPHSQQRGLRTGITSCGTKRDARSKFPYLPVYTQSGGVIFACTFVSGVISFCMQLACKHDYSIQPHIRDRSELLLNPACKTAAIGCDAPRGGPVTAKLGLALVARGLFFGQHGSCPSAHQVHRAWATLRQEWSITLLTCHRHLAKHVEAEPQHDSGVALVLRMRACWGGSLQAVVVSYGYGANSETGLEAMGCMVGFRGLHAARCTLHGSKNKVVISRITSHFRAGH